MLGAEGSGMMGESTNQPNAPQTGKRGTWGPSTGGPSGQRGGRHLWRGVLAIVLGCALLAVLLAQVVIPYTRYERVHDIPNPVWGILDQGYTFTPATAGKLNPMLLTIRPDQVLLRYLQDYLQVAGTYPCAPDLASYDNLSDPVLTGQTRTCPVHRPVAQIVINHVYVGKIGTEGGWPGAIVCYTIVYASGAKWTHLEYLNANQFAFYYRSAVRLTCWGSVGILGLYPRVVSNLPHGINYPVTTVAGREYRCQP
jgi:hypothetical protein